MALLAEVGLWEDAVELALGELDRELAIEVARRPAGDAALTRKLWLAVMRHAIGEGLAEGEEERVRELTIHLYTIKLKHTLLDISRGVCAELSFIDTQVY